MKQEEVDRAVELYTQSLREGTKALRACVPNPMVVQEVGLDGKPYPGSKSYYVEDGACGFAWVVVPSTSWFIRALKKAGMAAPKEQFSSGPGIPRYDWTRQSYHRGHVYWVHEGDQSVAKKEAFAEAMAEHLRNNGVEGAYAQSRLD